MPLDRNYLSVRCLRGVNQAVGSDATNFELPEGAKVTRRKTAVAPTVYSIRFNPGEVAALQSIAEQLVSRDRP